MSPNDGSMEGILHALQERAKELNCLYRVDEILSRSGVERADALRELIQALPPGWQYPDVCQAKLVLEGQVFTPPGFVETPWVMAAPVIYAGQRVGSIAVYYTERRPDADEGPFLKEERRLINTIAERIGYLLIQRRLARAIPADQAAGLPTREAGRWNVILEFLRGADRTLLTRVTRRMINYLCCNGVREADALLRRFTPPALWVEARETEENRPQTRMTPLDFEQLAQETFRLAAAELSEDEVVRCVQTWIREDNASFLFTALENVGTSLSDIANAIERFHARGVDEASLPIASRTGLRVALLRRLFIDQVDFVNRAKDFVHIEDFHDLVRHTVSFPGSHGRLGGKSAGLFVASKIVQRSPEYDSALHGIRVPRTWHIPSDGLLHFIHHNNMEDIYARKYREIDQVRQEYPFLIQAFKNSPFPPELRKGLAGALDEFEDRPVIVRSSSLLEDRSGSAFSGKYKSLFLANQGPKPVRLAALLDAIAEIYASVFGPDPIDYRKQRGLLDLHEEMGIMIQEVVGRRVGPYFLPAFAGVAYSSNEFRWSSRIRRDDGLLRIVPGLGTRAVDRLSDDYPVLIAPGQPTLRVNSSPDEILRYAPKKVDLLNLETNDFETIEVAALVREHGRAIPLLHRLVSRIDEGHIRRPVGHLLDPSADYVVTFEGLIADTPFVTQIRTLLRVLQERLGVPVDVEFASDGEALYLLQCRAQGYSAESAPAAIPRDILRERLLFSADRYVSNGQVGDVTHIVYIDHDAYHALPDAAAMREVGAVVGRLNSLLPKRQFILVGPGRWGSRGDIKLGVSVSYSEINNTAVLVEIARKKGNYVPDLSFGTHFFQDLVEGDIRYLPLYPDDASTVFNELFFTRSRNVLADLLPAAAHLADVVRVIDVPAQTEGLVLRVLMNADLDEAVGVLAEPAPASEAVESPRPVAPATREEHWRWRIRMAERLAAELDPQRFGVKALYVFGSAKNATAGPASDVDLLVHFAGTPSQRDELLLWLDGWSLCLAEINYLRTGYASRGLLDVHFVTDDDIAKRTSYAVKIDAITDAARPLPLGE